MTTIKILLAILLVSFTAKGQYTISGPECVENGIEYQYTISTTSAISNLQICISGGKLSGSNSNCSNDTKMTTFRVVWNAGISNGSISVSGNNGAKNKNVKITSPLQPGALTAASKTQTIEYNKVPNSLSCGIPTGGGCATNYTFQWQSSLDDVLWEDIPGATQQNLNFQNGLLHTKYFRRRVINSISNNIEYSEVAVVFVNPEKK